MSPPQVSAGSFEHPGTLLTAGFAADSIIGLLRDLAMLACIGSAAMDALVSAAFIGLYIIGACALAGHLHATCNAVYSGLAWLLGF